MEGNLKNNTILNSENNRKYKIVSLLGSGGQGEVYDVVCDGKHYALKWYSKAKMATTEQKNILNNLIKKGSPDDSFLWPQEMVYKDKCFGYIMPLRPKNYKSITDMMKRRVEPSFYVLCKIAYNLTSGYEKLHKMGYSYRDISFGNLFFEPVEGKVLICDNDNVSASGDKNSSVYGTPSFMAPEIVVGKAKPSKNTDLYSLAVLLFYMFMMGHPLEGKEEANIKCKDIHAMNKLYGTNPIFVFDPIKKENRPVRGYQDNVLIFWDIYPKKLKDLFMQSFTVGLNNPSKRVTERQWMKVFISLMSSIHKCSCGAEVFYDEIKESQGVSHVCWNCQNVVDFPASLVIGKNRIFLSPNTKIFAHYNKDNYDIETVIGTVVQNINNPSLWGIRNDSDTVWTYIKADGQQIPVPKGKTAGISKNIKINFGETEGYFL